MILLCSERKHKRVWDIYNECSNEGKSVTIYDFIIHLLISRESCKFYELICTQIVMNANIMRSSKYRPPLYIG